MRDYAEDQLPKGYYCLENRGDTLIVGVGFEHFNKEALLTLVVDGQLYVRGGLEPIPSPDLSSSLCSVRAYHRKK
jgi:hypothetical protein